MEFVIISGMSGAGKTSALHVLEDIGYYCVDNIPSSLLQTLYNLCRSSSDEGMKRVAVVVDVRGNENYKQMAAEIEEFKNENAGAKLRKRAESIRSLTKSAKALFPRRSSAR